MRRRRALVRVVVVVAGAAAVLLPGPTAAQAGCAGPVLGVGTAVDDSAPSSPAASLSAGQPVTVSGVWFHRGCDDTSVSGPGCRATPAQPITEAPLTDVELTLRQGSSSWVLDTRDAGDSAGRYSVTWHGRIPAAVRSGPATLVADSATLPVVIVR